jgi:uncharacterized protein
MRARSNWPAFKRLRMREIIEALGPNSDIDLMLEFEPDQAPSLPGFLDFQDALSKLFGGRTLDLAPPSILSNPYRRRSIEKDMKVLHAA